MTEQTQTKVIEHEHTEELVRDCYGIWRDAHSGWFSSQPAWTDLSDERREFWFAFISSIVKRVDLEQLSKKKSLLLAKPIEYKSH